MKSALNHPKVIIGIPIKVDIKWIIVLHGLFFSCCKDTIIYPLVMKYFNYKIEQGEEHEWKTVAKVMQTYEYLKMYA